ncbi:hypothetical protein NMQ14_06440 [Methyloversatilis sp. XJ19-13]|uniref:hypothetical protein n=1 Tax=Methyloversatilis sp. XJ19-13 TaxID=2963430 RepID=UPI00211CA479|nr:hypothetical protein [Methyloversatilis sp. XJ19-13]MCQ9373887.1 hypothetical protein [Methyloversatilis sp. XJ19-13]
MKNPSLTIAIFGNTNNYPLLLAQGLKLLGHNVRLIINRKDLLHRPEARYHEWADAYPDWVLDCSDITDDDIAFKTPAIDEALHHLTHKVDLAILNDSGLAFAAFLHSPHIALLTGSDLAYYANFDLLRLRTQLWDLEFKRSSRGRRHLAQYTDFVARQRDGILASEVVCYGQRGLIPSGDRMLDEIGVQDSRRLMLYLSNTLDLQPQTAPRNEQLSILSGSRIVFNPQKNTSLSAMDFKGTDVLLNGFSEFIKSGRQAVLRLPRKGQDLGAAEALVQTLGISDYVTWMDETSLTNYYQEVIAADLVCDQFGTSFPGMVTTDAYAMGRPVMAKLRNEIFSTRFPEPLPGFDASTPEQIFEQLTAVNSTRDRLVEMGEKSRAFAEQYLSPRSMAEQLLEKLEA